MRKKILGLLQRQTRTVPESSVPEIGESQAGIQVKESISFEKPPRSILIILILVVTLGLALAAAFRTSQTQAKQAEQSEAKKKSGTTLDEIERKRRAAAESARADIAKQKEDTERKRLAKEKADREASAAAGEVKKDADAARGQRPAGGPSQQVAYSVGQPVQGVPPTYSQPGGMKSVDGKDQSLPPPPPLPGTPYKPTPVTQTHITQGADSVKVRSSDLIVLEGDKDVAKSNSKSQPQDASINSFGLTTLKGGVYPANIQSDLLDEKMQQLLKTQQMLNKQLSQQQQVSQPFNATQLSPAMTGSVPQERDARLTQVQPDNKILLLQGRIIPVVLQDGINTDLKSDLQGVVSENVYDSIRGDILLIPQGSTVIAKVDSDVVMGQERVLILFSRLILPNGSYVNLKDMRGVDGQGYSGVGADVDNHFFKQFGAGLLMAVVTYGAEREASKNVTVNVNGSGNTNLSTAVGDVLKDVTGRILDRYKNLKPTLLVAPGEKIKVKVNQDMIMTPYQM
ncbi:hypothetical protein HA052_04950 [Chromobacterium haemolyticum]|uniref:Conjugal transfer protein TrbI n=1 Tax=Chromobacterium fluminis TaxID=3044269 RepID=A0ABX0KYA8_9NEIS|nr:TrbI/VirB10 family protein [Chromobacterium haemolyticum]NHR04539.1 hypothetical protein [Chromobacterium haemolyticum]